MPRCIVIAGPNGAGKTTFARQYLPKDAGVMRFINADLIAGGLSPLKPELAALAAGRLFLSEVDRLAAAEEDFAFETTLSGVGHVHHLKLWKAAGYRIEMIFLRLPSPRLSVCRIRARVKQGGHFVPKNDVIRRFERGWRNFQTVYQPLADSWIVGDNAAGPIRVIEQREAPPTVEAALRRAAKAARKVAHMYGTANYFWRGGKVVSVKP